MDRFTGLLGVLVMIGLAACLSFDRRKIPWRLVAAGVGVQFGLAAAVLLLPGFKRVFEGLGWFVNQVILRSEAGIDFVFGPALRDDAKPWGFIFAVKVLPIVVFFSALMSVLYYLGIMQKVVAALAWVLRATLRVSGVEAMCAAANVFLGQTEAPLTVRPFIPAMTRAQLTLVMVSGFATIAGSVLGAYVMLLGGADEPARVRFATHLIGASLMAAPASFVMARIICPETETQPPEDARSLANAAREDHTNVFDAAAAGATTGMQLAINIAAMLIAFLSLLALINWPIHAIGEIASVKSFLMTNGLVPIQNGPDGPTTTGLSISVILGWLFSPLAWTMGVPWSDARIVGALLGEKLVATEFVAFLNLAAANGSGTISSRSAQITTYALCGFANFASIAIQIGGLSVLAPTRRKDFARLALRAMLGGALATQMTASIAGLFIE